MLEVMLVSICASFVCVGLWHIFDATASVPDRDRWWHNKDHKWW